MTTLEPAWLDELRARAVDIPFFTLAKYLERAASASGFSIRFAHDVQLIFHASEVVGLQTIPGNNPVRVRLTTSFLGLVGSVSPLPTYFSEEILRGESLDDTALRDFYDVLHHRMIGLHFRGMFRGAPVADLSLRGDDRATARSMAASGLCADRREAARGASHSWLAAAKVLGRRPRSRPALEEALAIALPHLSFRIGDFLPGFASGGFRQGPRVGSGELRVGRGVRVGRYARAHASGVRLIVGPVAGAQFRTLLPGGRDFEVLRTVVRDILAGRSDAELEVEVRAGAEPRARVGRRFGSLVGRGTLVLGSGRLQRTVRARVALTGDATGKAVFLVNNAIGAAR